MNDHLLKYKYPTRLLEALKEHLSEKILDHIAQADAGLGALENRKNIDDILETNTVPYPLQFNPKEAFMMTMWWRPDRGVAQSISSVQRQEEHLARAFCCACLLTNTPSEYGIEPADVLPRLIQSIIEIDTALLSHTREMVMCSTQNHSDESDSDMRFDNMLCRLALILIDAHGVSPLRADGELNARCKQLIQDELAYRDNEEVCSLINEYSLSNYPNWDQWLLGMTFFDQSLDDWKEISENILLNLRNDLTETDRLGCIELAENILKQ